MSLDRALADIMKNVPECIATGWVDMTTGTVLAVNANPAGGQPQALLDQVTAATTDILHGANVVAIEELFNQTRSEASAEHRFREIIVLTHSFVHVFARGKHRRDHVLLIVTRVSANLGTVITRTRAALSAAETEDKAEDADADADAG
ncbi:MAG TPA: hypothetical protein VK607_24700, partial [Kofleriaceae bacterium]|nr:hypothetical protein [Kofleriaceae bacterium]